MNIRAWFRRSDAAPLYQLNDELFEGPGVYTFGKVKLDVDHQGQFRLQGREDFPVLAFAKPVVSDA